MKPIWVRLKQCLPCCGNDRIFVVVVFANSVDNSLPDSIADFMHRGILHIPVIKISHYGNASGMRCPDAKYCLLTVVLPAKMRAHIFICFCISSLMKQMDSQTVFAGFHGNLLLHVESSFELFLMDLFYFYFSNSVSIFQVLFGNLLKYYFIVFCYFVRIT